jgi:hypothetical protein
MTPSRLLAKHICQSSSEGGIVRGHAPAREYGTFLKDSLSVLNAIRSSDEHTVTWFVKLSSKLSDLVCQEVLGRTVTSPLQHDVHCRTSKLFGPCSSKV